MRFATSFWRCAGLACMSLAFFAAEGHCQSWVDWRTKDNFKELKVDEMEKECKLTALNQPAGIYFPGEQCEITLIAPEKPEDAIDGGTLELIGVHNRNAAKGEVGFVLVTSGPRITRVERQPIRVAIDASKAANGELKVKLPLPDEFGTNVIVLERKGGKRSFIGSVARVLKSVESKGEVPHIMAESGVSNFTGLSVIGGAEPFAAAYERMGVKLMRWEFHWQQPRQGDPYEWKMLDNGLNAVANHHIKLLNTMGAQAGWSMPLGGGPTPAALHTENHISSRKYNDDYGKWVRALVGRYWKGGKEGLWAIEHYNEPWEPVSCAGWQSDSCRYRELLEILSREAHSVAPGMKIAAACSIMNTEDKLTSDGSAERMKWIDLMTDHYVTPCSSYGGRVAQKYGKISGETETWGVCTEVLLPQFMTQFLAIGNTWVNPMQGDMPVEELGWQNHSLLTPKTLVPAVAAYNAIIADRPFERIAFTKHLPWLYQFGPDKDARFVLYGRAIPLASGNVRDVVWRQAAEGNDGTITITDVEGALVVQDMEGNILKPSADKTYQLPMSPTAFYLQSEKGAAYVIEHVRAGKLAGIRQVEILPGTLTARPTASQPASLPVTLHNLRNVPLSGELKVTSLLPEYPVTFADKFEIPAGESKTLSLPIAKLPESGLPVTFTATMAGGTETWQEVVRATAIPHATIAIDGGAAPWANVPATTVIRPEGDNQGNVIERAWLPFIEKKAEAVPAKHADMRFAWDDQYLYLRGSVESTEPTKHDRFVGWDQDQYFYSAKTDEICESLRQFETVIRHRPGNMNDGEGFKRFQAHPQYNELMTYLSTRPAEAELVDLGAVGCYFERKQRDPSATWADASFVYKKDISQQHAFGGDSLQIAFDRDPVSQRAEKTHDLKYPQGTLPANYQSLPDTDYEFAVYTCPDGKSEVMCLLSPGMPRVHVYPRQPRGDIYPFTVTDAKSDVQFADGRVTYTLALPWKSIGLEKPAAGKDFGMIFRFNASKGNRVEFGADMASTKSNGLSMHPYWAAGPSNTVRWTLAQ